MFCYCISICDLNTDECRIRVIIAALSLPISPSVPIDTRSTPFEHCDSLFFPQGLEKYNADERNRREGQQRRQFFQEGFPPPQKSFSDFRRELGSYM